MTTIHTLRSTVAFSILLVNSLSMLLACHKQSYKSGYTKDIVQYFQINEPSAFIIRKRPIQRLLLKYLYAMVSHTRFLLSLDKSTGKGLSMFGKYVF